MDTGHTRQGLRTVENDASHTVLQNEDVARRLLNNPTHPERQISGRSNCNQGEYTYMINKW